MAVRGPTATAGATPCTTTAAAAAALASLALLLGGGRPAAAADFYVSSSTGSDAAAGTDPAHPWQSLARVAAAPVRAGDQVLLAQGDAWAEPLVVAAVGTGCAGAGMRGEFEELELNATSAVVTGWVVDSRLPGGGAAPVTVQVLVNGTPTTVAVANVSRGDLVPAGVAPDPRHGFVVDLGASMAAAMQHGVTRVGVAATSTEPGCSPLSWAVPWYGAGHQCGCAGTPCVCPEAPPAAAVRVAAFALNATAKSESPSSSVARPVVVLNGTGAGVTVRGFDSAEVVGVEVRHADHGVVVWGGSGGSPGAAGHASVADCVFRGVWNRSSIGQTLPTKGRDCTNGWSPTVQAGGFANLTVANCLFDDVDVALQPTGALGVAEFSGNTLQHANGNTVMMVGTTDWRVHDNVFSRDDAPRFFMCGTTDIMVGGLGTTGSIFRNEIGLRGEHTGSPDGCGIDYEGGSDGVSVVDNVIHDSYGAGVMVFGMSDRSRNISNATLARNVFLRNGAQQTSDDRGEIAFMEFGSTGECRDNVFFAETTDAGFVFNERTNGTLELGWVMANNTVRPITDIPGAMADTPAVSSIMFDAGGVAHVALVSRHHPARNGTLLFTTDNSWPQLGAPGTAATALPAGGAVDVTVPRTAAVNARLLVDGLLPSLTMTLVVPVPAGSAD